MDLVNKGGTTRNIAKKVGQSQTSVRYWLKKYQLKTILAIYRKNGNKPYNCVTCGESNSKEFYGRRKIMCKKCDTKRVVELSHRNKQKAVDYKGGCCIECGYKKCLSALEFHHHGTLKDHNFTNCLLWKWERLKKEIDKCILLCSNCHREVHAK